MSPFDPISNSKYIKGALLFFVLKVWTDATLWIKAPRHWHQVCTVYCSAVTRRQGLWWRFALSYVWVV